VNDLRRLVAKTTALGVGLAAVSPKMVYAAALVIEKSVSRQIGKDAPRRRVAGGSVGVNHRTLRTGQNPAVLVKATGPLHLLANPTQAHGEVARRASAMSTPYGPKSRVNHPGTAGKNTWHKGVDEGEGAAVLAADTVAVAAVRAAFR
jgi:hypothetical protein